jgi:hypothetical protein
MHGHRPGQLQRLALRRAVGAAVQRSGCSVRYAHQVISAKRATTAVAVKLVAAGAEQLATGGVGAGPDFEDCVPAVFVVFDGESVKFRTAGGAGSGGEGL